MNIYQKIRIFILSRLFGIFLLGISSFLIISIYTYSTNDPTFGNITPTNNIYNFFGIYGSYPAGILFVFLYNASYLVPLFFLTTGLKSVLGIKYNNFIYQLFVFVIGLFFLNLSFALINIETGVAGSFLFDLLQQHFPKYMAMKYLIWGIFIITFFIAVFLLIHGLTLKTKILYFLLFSVLSLLKKIFIPLKFIKTPSLRFDKIHLKSPRLNKKEGRIKKEPTINKSVRSYKDEERELKETALSFDSKYKLPPFELLNVSETKKINNSEIEKKNQEYSKKLEMILAEYGVEGRITNYKTGPVITLFEFIPAAGIKTSKVVGLSEDIARAMSSVSTRISAQPGKNSIGIEMPNNNRQDVYLGDLLVDEDFTNKRKTLTLALGKNISGEKIFTDLEKMPHLLIAGTTGSGKSVGINCMILSLLFKFKPSECKLILIDPKMLELSIYEDIPHLLSPVVTDPKKAVHALKWVVREMENRYRLMSSTNVKTIHSFNSKVELVASQGKKLFREVQTGIDNDTRKPIFEKVEIPLEKMPYIVVIIDEMADLMMVAGKEVENLVQRLAQMARASGIHLITATQRPSVDVITGTIKANFPSRISFRVASRFDSRTILNEMGAEQLLGSGDMLFLENGSNLIRLHGGYVSENEIENVVNHIKSQSTFEDQKDITSDLDLEKTNELDFNIQNDNTDELYNKAVSIVINQQKVSTSFIQRYLQIGYNRAARIVEQMEAEGIISEPTHAGKRSVLKKK